MDDVRLPDLEVIRRFSIAVRREHAPVDEVIEALRQDLARLTGGKTARRSGSEDAPEAPAPTKRAKATPRPQATPAKRSTATQANSKATPKRAGSKRRG